MSDIRGSGAPVQDSSIIILMWNEKKNERSTQLTVQIAKNRSGATGEVKLFLIGEASKFTEPSFRED
jgi:replicative DNA helicase